MAYAAPADCRTFSEAAAVDAKTDGELNTLIARAERLINAYTQNEFNLSGSQSIRLDGSGSRRLILPDRLAVLEELKFQRLDDGTIVKSETTIKDVYNRNWWLVSDFVFPLGFQNILVKGTFGYASVPPEIQDATCSLVERIVLSETDTTAKSGLYDRERIGDYEYELRGTSSGAAAASLAQKLFPDDALLALHKFKRPLLMTAVRRLNRGVFPKRKLREI